MLRRWKVFMLAVALTVGLGVGGSSSAALFTVQELVDGTSFNSPDGNLHFDNFTFTVVTGSSLSTDLTDYQVLTDGSITSGGFRLVGPIAVAGGNFGDIIFTFDVTANSGKFIDSAGLYFNGRAFGTGAIASVSEDVFDPGQTDPVGRLTVFSNGGPDGEANYQIVDLIEFQEVYASLHIEKDISVISDGGIFAAISVIDQHFTVVPEPNTASLMAVGLVGVGVWQSRGQRRRRPGGAAAPI